jgi:hypothetical protein
MRRTGSTPGARKDLFGWMGTVLLLGILPIKLLRFGHHGPASFAIGVAPSLLGPAGLLFLLLSDAWWTSHHGLLRLTLLVAAASLGLEFAQLLPRPGFLARIHYTFDYADLVGTAISVGAAYAISSWILASPRR